MIWHMTGCQLRAVRLALGFTQTAVARKAGLNRHSVIYWEKAHRSFDPRYGVPGRILIAMGLTTRPGPLLYGGASASAQAFCNPLSIRSPCARGDELLLFVGDENGVTDEVRVFGSIRPRVFIWRQNDVRCGARTRRGSACRNMPEPGKKRCKFHGGKSTGPKTAAGKKRISEAQKLRWARVRGAAAE